MEGAAPLRVYSLSPLGSGVLGGSVLSRLNLGGPHLVAPNHIPGFLDPAGLWRRKIPRDGITPRMVTVAFFLSWGAKERKPQQEAGERGVVKAGSLGRFLDSAAGGKVQFKWWKPQGREGS